ncbi:hypothetical protein R69888_02054 [Paraburkholderia haematera]|uniref:Uncharacterized protein n=2 Tax=Paraburkholderia haematera TaxID=2793077 RepID=A0ABN7L553_9BURK|nr:hypothetical protein R69888_02054 [Paraburkholderia haematera]
MVAMKSSLRGLREKLQATAGAMPARLLALHGSQDGLTCRVCIEIRRPDGPIVLFFYRHGDGTWHVFPPGDNQGRMGFERLVA